MTSSKSVDRNERTSTSFILWILFLLWAFGGKQKEIIIKSKPQTEQQEEEE